MLSKSLDNWNKPQMTDRIDPPKTTQRQRHKLNGLLFRVLTTEHNSDHIIEYELRLDCNT